MVKRYCFAFLFSILICSPFVVCAKDGITTNSDGSVRLKRNDIDVTIAGEHLDGYGYYYWGFLNNTENSKWTTSTSTYGLNDIRGGGNDSQLNGYNSGLNPKRQGPCPLGWHVPSKGEWNDLMIARCNLSDECNPDVNLEIFDDGSVDLTVIGRGDKFKKLLNINPTDYIFWTSSPYLDDDRYAWGVFTSDGVLHTHVSETRAFGALIRCFKDYNTSSAELYDAYNFAFDNGITTMKTIQEADMDGKLSRIAMAKMLSNYAIKVLGKNPDTSRVKTFSDVDIDLDLEYGNAVTLAYQLGIMGIGNDEFRPQGLVTRKEFGTALSRLLYGLEDGNPYYTTHLTRLKTEKIISNDNPDLIETRGYVMLMLMRAADNFIPKDKEEGENLVESDKSKNVIERERVNEEAGNIIDVVESEVGMDDYVIYR